LSRLPEGTQAAAIEELMKSQNFTYEKVEKIEKAEAERVLGTQNKREAAREATKEDFSAGEHARIWFTTRDQGKLSQCSC
jgi:hypothetical protein